MTKTALLHKLKQEINNEEYSLLLENQVPNISKFNRQLLLDMMHMSFASEGEASDDQVEALRSALVSYLGVYMADAESGWKWIILTCIFLRFVCEKPLHPHDAVKYITKTVDDHTHYFCPAKDETIGSVCLFCVCKDIKAMN